MSVHTKRTSVSGGDELIAEKNESLSLDDLEFRQWLTTEYFPIAGGWQY
jgi:hypothetical protein